MVAACCKELLWILRKWMRSICSGEWNLHINVWGTWAPQSPGAGEVESRSLPLITDVCCHYRYLPCFGTCEIREQRACPWHQVKWPATGFSTWWKFHNVNFLTEWYFYMPFGADRLHFTKSYHLFQGWFSKNCTVSKLNQQYLRT